MLKQIVLVFLVAVLSVTSFSFLYSGNANSRNTSSAKSGAVRNRSKAEPVRKKTSVVFEGMVDGKGTFTFQEDRIVYKHEAYDYPTEVTINGKAWANLDEPFELGFVPVFSTADVVEKQGRNSISVNAFKDKVELSIYDSDASSAHYRVSIVFEQEFSPGQESGARNGKKDLDDDDDEVFISLPGDRGDKKEKKTASADTKKAPGDNEKLQGVLYLLTRRAGGRSTLIASSGKKEDEDIIVFPVLQKFVLGSWPMFTNSKGERYYSELEQNFKRQAAPGFSYFYQDRVSWEKGAELFRCGESVGEAGWVAVYSGYVVAPFSGKFRFLGFCDDMMVVRFNRQIVIDYGWRSLTTGLSLDSGTIDYHSILNGKSATREEKRVINESPLYSKNRLEVSFPDFDEQHGLARSPVLSVQKGQVIPVDILLGEQCVNRFCMVLLVECLDTNGRPFDNPSKSIFLFRTTSELPELTDGGSLPKFNADSPVWKVVDSKGKPIPAKTAQKSK